MSTPAQGANCCVPWCSCESAPRGSILPSSPGRSPSEAPGLQAFGRPPAPTLVILATKPIKAHTGFRTLLLPAGPHALTALPPLPAYAATGHNCPPPRGPSLSLCHLHAHPFCASAHARLSRPLPSSLNQISAPQTVWPSQPKTLKALSASAERGQRGAGVMA